MTDLTQITTAYGLLDAGTREALRRWEGKHECFNGAYWATKPDGSFDGSKTYRARALVPDTIDWSHVAPEWKFMARDESGQVFLYDEKPEPDPEGWHTHGTWETATVFASYKRGTVAWQDSLVKRPS